MSEPITLDEEPVCAGCGKEPVEDEDYFVIPQNVDEDDEDPSPELMNWTRSETGFLCEDCSNTAADQKKADEEAGVTDRRGQSNVAERVVMETVYADAPPELLDKVLAETPIAPVLLENAEHTAELDDGRLIGDARFLTKPAASDKVGT